MKIGFLQYRPVWGKPSRNMATVLPLLAASGADLLVLPELAFTGYAFRDRAEVESLAEIPAESARVAALATCCAGHGLHVVTGFAEREGDRCYNSALLIGPGGLVGTYRKIHLFNTEKNCFDPGTQPPPVHDIGIARVGLMICFDWIFPETARVLALQGADILCHPSNLVLPGLCQPAMRTRSLENRVYTVTANRTGTERGLRFTGRSQITAPDGTVLRQAPAREVRVEVVDVDPAAARNKRITPLNDLMDDRHPSFYGAITMPRS